MSYYVVSHQNLNIYDCLYSIFYIAFRLFDLDELENYILQHLSCYKENPCFFPGVRGTDITKVKINEFFEQCRERSMGSTILFKANSSKTTLTQQLLLKNGELYLFVDDFIKAKLAKSKKKFCTGINN